MSARMNASASSSSWQTDAAGVAAPVLSASIEEHLQRLPPGRGLLWRLLVGPAARQRQSDHSHKHHHSDRKQAASPDRPELQPAVSPQAGAQQLGPWGAAGRAGARMEIV